MDTQDERLQQLKFWLNGCLGEKGFALKRATEDASFRRYFRVWSGEQTYIAMDALPPDQSTCQAFVDIGRLLQQHGLHVPHIFAADIESGFLLLSDLGNTPYLTKLDAKTANRLYDDALSSLLRIQTRVPATSLPPYNAAMLEYELSIFVEWFLQGYLKLKLDEQAQQIIDVTFRLLVNNALEQPQVFMHRDYHSRNLMVTDNDNPGILDFQGAVQGPITYDLVSLLRDCYIAWPKAQVEQWMTAHYEQLVHAGLLDTPLQRFRQWFDWTGLQRHLKAIGIFCRLQHTRQKSAYLLDIPRTFNYVYEVCERYPQLEAFKNLLDRFLVRERLPA